MSSALSQPAQVLFADDAAIEDPNALRLAVTLFDRGDDLLERGDVAPIAVEDLVGQGEPFLCDHERDDQLLAVVAMIAAIAAFGFWDLLGGALKIRARQIIEHDLETGAEQASPLLC